VGGVLRILQISASAGYGGGPKHLHDLASHLVPDVMVDIACPRQEPYWDKFDRLVNGKLVEIPERRFTLRAAWRLVRHVKSHDVSMIHSHGKGAGVYARFVRLCTGVPVVHTPHGIHYEKYSGLGRKLYLAYERCTGLLCNAVIFVSDSERTRAEKMSIWPRVPQWTVYNGVRSRPEEGVYEWRQAVRRERSVPSDAPVVVTLARFDYQKNIEELVELAARMPDVRFWCLGDGPGRGEIQSSCRTRGIENLWFAGFVPDPVCYLAAADIYVSTSRGEGMPLSLLEAMAIGRPAVATDVTGNCDAVEHGETGWLYPQGQLETAVEWIRRLVDARDQRERMGANARARQRQLFSLETMAEGTRKVYLAVSGASA